jgi:hypothetical protein
MKKVSSAFTCKTFFCCYPHIIAYENLMLGTGMASQYISTVLG